MLWVRRERLKRLDDLHVPCFTPLAGRATRLPSCTNSWSVVDQQLPRLLNMCHESSGKALGSTIGIGKGTVRLSDFDEADVIVVIVRTQAPTIRGCCLPPRCKAQRSTHHPREPASRGWTRALQAPARLHGGPLYDQLADLHLPVRIGGDAAPSKRCNTWPLRTRCTRPSSTRPPAVSMPWRKHGRTLIGNVSPTTRD